MVYGKGGYGRSKNILLSECVCGIISLELNGFQYFLRGMETFICFDTCKDPHSFNTSLEVWKLVVLIFALRR